MPANRRTVDMVALFGRPVGAGEQQGGPGGVADLNHVAVGFGITLRHASRSFFVVALTGSPRPQNLQGSKHTKLCLMPLNSGGNRESWRKLPVRYTEGRGECKGGGMNTEQLALWIAVVTLVAQIIQTYVAVRAHRQQPGAAMRKPKAEASPTGLPRNVMFRLIGLAAIGWAAVLFGYFSQHKDNLRDAFLAEMVGRPLGWSGPYISGTNEGTFISEDKLNVRPKIRAISFTGHNFGIEEVVIEAAYLIFGINGKRLDLNVSWGGQRFAPKDLNPIPPQRLFF